MAKTSIRMEGGQEGAPDTIFLENDRLAATLKRADGTYQLSSLRAGGETELLAGPSPLLSCFDGKEHLAVPFEGVTVTQDEPNAVSLRFAVERNTLSVELILSLTTGRPYLEWDASVRSAEDWRGLIYFTCFAHDEFVPTAYPWIAGTTLTDNGFAYANCMGAPLLAGDPRGINGHTLAVGFPLSANYRDLFFHYSAEDRRIAAGVGEGRSRPAGLPADWMAAAEAEEQPRGLLARFRRQPEPEAPPEVPPLSMEIPYRAGQTYRLPLQVWAITGEQRNVAGEWMKASGFTFDNPGIRSVPDSLRMTLEFLHHGAPFLQGKAYPMRARRYTCAPGRGEGGRIHLYGNAALACALYRCWGRYREDWMRDRALAIADFIIAARRSNGAIPEVFDPRTGEWGRLGEGTHYEGAGLCIESLLRLYLLRRQLEQKDDVRLRRAANSFLQVAIEQRRRRIDIERRKGKRRQDKETTFPYSGSDITESPNINLMLVLERQRQMTNDRQMERAREDAEKWILHNVYHDMSWRGGLAQHTGIDARSLLRFIEYAVLRRDATQGKRYQDMAELLASYLLFTLVPKDLEWCQGRTKGLQIACGNWRALTVAYADHVQPVPALHRLGKLCNDRFYAQLGDYLVQTAMLAQCDEKGVPGYGGWMPALNSPDGNAFALNGLPYGGDLCVTSIVPAVLETYLYLTEPK